MPGVLLAVRRVGELPEPLDGGAREPAVLKARPHEPSVPAAGAPAIVQA